MIYTISLLTAYMVAVIYPMCFWISWPDPLKQGFHRFHTGLSVFLCGIVVVFIFIGDFQAGIKMLSVLWLLLLSGISFFYWNRPYPDPVSLTIASMIGAVGYIRLSNLLIGFSFETLLISFLAGFIFCASLFAMNLGHWYLNVHGLPVSHLRRSTYVLAFFLTLRFLWNLYEFLTGHLIYQGEELSLLAFSVTMDGFLLYIGFLFGIFFPLGASYLVLETLKLKNTQSATGILYVMLCAVLIGDMTFKYYLYKFGVPL